MNNLQELLEKIEADKEVLNILPQNNKKNIKTYLLKNQELQEEYNNYKKEILEEIETRFNKIKNVKENTKINKLKNELNDTEKILYLLNNIDTSYEKMNLDRAIQNLSYYYKNNLEIVNESILFTIRKFEEVGIHLTNKDFSYSNYTYEYITMFFEEVYKNGNINSEKIKTKFEEIYWKCPDIITHIALNFKYLYLKNEKIINKYYTIQKSNLIKKSTSEEILEKYMDLKRKVILAQKNDEYKIINNILDNKINIKDYEKNNIKNEYLKFISEDDFNEDQLDEIDNNMIKLLNSIYEYSKYCKFKFIIDNIKQVYSEKDKYKNSYNIIKKEIGKKEKKVIELNKKINGKGLFKKSNDTYTTEQNNLILELKKSYKELDQNKVYNKINTELKNNSTLKDVIDFASSFYKYLYDLIAHNNKDITEEEIEDIINEIKEFGKWPYCTILNNIEILEQKDIALIIKDRYKLLNINISKEDLQEENLDDLIKTIEKIEMYYYIRANKIDVDNMIKICEFKKILKNK